MPDTSGAAAMGQLLDAAFAETLAKFREQVQRGEIDPQAEREECRRRRRDYATSLRMGSVPDEAMTLAARLLQDSGLKLSAEETAAFRIDVTHMLIRLHEAFIAAADQGNR